MTISSTTWKLLKFAKSSNHGEFNYQSLKEVLVPLFHEDMMLHDCMSILLKSLQEVMDEPKFELEYGRDFLRIVILAPMDRNYFINDAEKDIHYCYDKMIAEILYGYGFTRADWCKEMIDKA